MVFLASFAAFAVLKKSLSDYDFGKCFPNCLLPAKSLFHSTRFLWYKESALLCA